MNRSRTEALGRLIHDCNNVLSECYLAQDEWADGAADAPQKMSASLDRLTETLQSWSFVFGSLHQKFADTHKTAEVLHHLEEVCEGLFRKAQKSAVWKWSGIETFQEPIGVALNEFYDSLLQTLESLPKEVEVQVQIHEEAIRIQVSSVDPKQICLSKNFKRPLKKSEF